MRQTITNFNKGIKASSGYTPYKNISASEVINFDVDDYGRLVRRKGSVHINSTELPAPAKSMIRAYYHTGVGSNEHLIITVQDSQGVWYLSSGNFTELKNSSDSPASSVDLSGVQPRFDFAVYLGRLFMGNGTSEPPPRSYWIDISSDPPVLYYHGIRHGGGSGSPPSAPTLSLAAGGSLTDGKWYGYAVTFYRHGEEIESRSSTRSTIQISAPNQTVDISGVTVSDDKQVTRRKIYRTDAQNSQAEALSADLKLIHTINDNTTTTYSDSGDTGGTVNSTTDHDFPPQYRYITEHAGRLWIADDDDSSVYFSKFDSTGAPVVDVFPYEHADVVHSFDVSKDDGDFITALLPSPLGQQLLVFKRNSVYVIYGNSPATIDASTRLPAAGCVAPCSIANVGTVIYFLTNDKKVWVTNGHALSPLSLPVQPILDQIPFSRFSQVIGCEYDGKYLLAFPDGDKENNRILVYDPDRKYWTMYDLAVNWLSWWSGDESNDADRNRLIGALSGGNYVDYLFTDANGNELTDDNGADITASWQSNWFEFPHPTTITGIYIYDDTGSTYTVQIDSKGESGIQTGTIYSGFTPEASNSYRQGCFIRCHQARFKIETSNDAIISRMEIEFERR